MSRDSPKNNINLVVCICQLVTVSARQFLASAGSLSRGVDQLLVK